MRRLLLLFLAIAHVGPGFSLASLKPGPAIELRSPNGRVMFGVSADAAGRLTYRVVSRGTSVIDRSPIGIVVDGTNLGEGAAIGTVDRYRIREKYPWRGVHAEAVNHANGARIAARHAGSGVDFTIDVRAFDDGIAFRHEVAGPGRRVPDAASGFQLPPGSVVWFHGLRDHYEAVYERKNIEDVRDGEWAAPPVTFKRPGGRGYASITEADLRDYAGMALQADGAGGFRERLAHTHPAGYPFTLRFGEQEARRLAHAAAIDGPIRTPWRVVIVGADLDTLVNSDIVPNLCRPPDPTLFPQGMRTAWLRPGRAVWRYLDGGENTFEGIKEFSRLAGELGFEHHVVEGLWQRWTEDQLRELVEYSLARNVGIFVWRHRNTLGDPEKRRALFASLHKAGVAGVKVDFLDHEAKEVIDLY